MGQKTNPNGLRFGKFKKHFSCWYTENKNYSHFVKQDIFIRKFLMEKIKNVFISLIEIEKDNKETVIFIHYLNFSKFNKVETNSEKNEINLFKLKNLLLKSLNSFFNVKINFNEFIIKLIEIENPILDVRFIANDIRYKLEKRMNFRKIVNSTIANIINKGIKGIKIKLSGRLNDAEMAREESFREGKVPLNTLKANIDYFHCTAKTLSGSLGIKVWLNK
uniref:Small ribosomal subunit protein uS3c n=1 Tax=Euglena longa TaxID=3037 RepID=RR3_EUGLO|nr:ribosomal protein S3 [Euglena longa]P58133.1 RecName: Full=Small ribosomal subunit protein uS3c; AltName: Full=Plastid 30S ribosomal protein S3 [Euglena longa]CAC24598.1 ribosomal protein S3 [Euglena longa]